MSEEIVDNEVTDTTVTDSTTEPAEKTFTQADMDKAVAQRLAREQRKYEKTIPAPIRQDVTIHP